MSQRDTSPVPGNSDTHEEPLLVGAASRSLAADSSTRALVPDRRVRPALTTDAPAIARLQRRALCALDPAFFNVDTTVLEEHWRQTLSTTPAPAGCATFVALHAHTLVGFALVTPAPALEHLKIAEGCDIAELLIDPSFTRSGHGSRLLAAIADHHAGQTARIWASAEDEAKIRFLDSAGFVPAGCTRILEGPSGEIVQHLWWTQIDHAPTH